MPHAPDKSTLARRIAKRRQAVTLVLDAPPDRHLRAEARRRGWQFLNVLYCGGKVFPWLEAHGALVSALQDNEIVILIKGVAISYPYPMLEQ